MNFWWIILIVFGLILVLFAGYALFCLVVFVRGVKVNLKRPIEFSLSQYNHDKKRLNDDFKYFESLNFSALTIKSHDNLTLKADFLKNNSKKFIIFFHGYRSSAKNDFSCMTKFYYDLGYNLIFVWQRSHGKSEGVLMTYGLKESIDAKNWCNFVRKEFNPSQLVVVGMSMGASSLLFASNDICADKMICDCGFSSPRKIILNTLKTLHIAFFPTFNIIKFYAKIFKIDISKNATSVLKNSKIPILFIHGKADRFVPVCMTIENYNAKPNNKEILLVENAHHAASYLTNTPLYEEKVKEFLAKN